MKVVKDMTETLGNTEFENLSAFLDVELDGPRAAEVARLVREDATWRNAYRELAALDAALDAYTVPQPAGDLVDRVLFGVHASARRSHVLRVIAWVAPVAAAAAILLVAIALSARPGGSGGTSPDPTITAKAIEQEIEASEAYQDVPQAQRAGLEEEIVKNYGVLRGLLEDYDVVADLDTLDAIEQIEQEGT